MNDIKIFNNEEFGDIRTVTIDGDPWFVGKLFLSLAKQAVLI